MDDVSKIDPELWARYKQKCGEFGPKLVRLQDWFRGIAAGAYDDSSAYTEICVDYELETIRYELHHALDPDRYPLAHDF